MLPIISNDKGWRRIGYQKIKVWYYGDIDENIIKQLCLKIRKLNNNNINLFKKEVIKLKGNFAFIIKKNKNCIIAFVDRIKSVPIFVAKISKNYWLSNSASHLKDKMETIEKCQKSILSMRMAGYCLGRNTLYKNLLQLLPGEICVIKNNKVSFSNYYSFINTKKRNFKASKTSLSKKLSDLTLDIFQEILNKYSEKIVVPLSAGYDSRLIISALHHLNAKNVICFSYGRKNNFESKIAKHIANKLNYKWHFVELSNKKQRKNFRSNFYKEYTKFSDTLCSWSYVQDLFAVRELVESKIINSECIILNGNTGDFISGGHLPSLNNKLNSKKDRLNDILNYILKKHFSLWENYFDNKQKITIKKIILENLPKSLNKLHKLEEYKIYEYVEFLNRQSNYVIQGQRVYDFLNIKWELPLWHDSYLEFWNRVPYKFKLNQELYKDTLLKNNWGNVWQNIPVNKYYITPRSLRYIRNILKIFFLFKSKNDWSKFDKKYISYFTELIPHYSYFNYFDIIKEKKVARNAVAWHVDNYLKLRKLI